ncbi:MAG: DNA repair protein RecO [Tabrizicola sp.]|jgi:DNA repair protein RecO (recombination protein O)|uniref:DNA repair protein RecO n=1 Tax=Tabrizicola sp. TaxID=2005166 RepID=UPI001B740C7C|nr:DNA repair protein RecO [Tabrizicola sp.]MCC6517219.1 DNA repair protein RecO [Tabrizicola sp.]
MDWRDEGILLAMRPHGETSAIIEVLTAAHGRHMGVVRGGASRRMAASLQPGTGLALDWRARLDGHIGSFTVEPLKSRAHLLADRLALAGLMSACALLHEALPEREPHPALWQRTLGLMDALGQAGWTAAYLRWELCLLEEIGFGLDLGTCAVTGATAGLAYVSPKSGRAVTAQAAGTWADRLIPLPEGLDGVAPLAPEAVLMGLRLTGFFLDRELRPVLHDRPLPEARARLVDLIARPSRNDG